jgi:hypothetical protein
MRGMACGLFQRSPTMTDRPWPQSPGMADRPRQQTLMHGYRSRQRNPGIAGWPGPQNPCMAFGLGHWHLSPCCFHLCGRGKQASFQALPKHQEKSDFLNKSGGKDQIYVHTCKCILN